MFLLPLTEVTLTKVLLPLTEVTLTKVLLLQTEVTLLLLSEGGEP
jgi:hypothetical protein